MKKDILMQALLAGGSMRLYAISAQNMVRQAKEIHGLSRVCTAALGRQLMATAMMAMQLKHEDERLTTILNGGGPTGNLVCTGSYGAIVKGYVANPEVELPPNKAGKLDVSKAVGSNGKLTVIRDLSLKEPYTGTCALVSGEIAEDFAQYFTVSEQQPSLVYLGVRIKPQTGEVLSAGGLIAQPMPGFPEEEIDAAIKQMESCISGIATLSERLELAPLKDVIETLFYDMHIAFVGETMPLLYCDCSRDRTSQALIALGEGELTTLINEDDGAELTCQFCNARYQFSGAELKALLDEAKENAE